MKHRNKALLSSLAMLVVTAITLSSATYAWFTAGTVVSVDEISASITNTDGSLLISADGGTTWGIRASAADMLAYGPNIFPEAGGVEVVTGGTFIPVSVTPSSQQIIAGAINGETHKFTATGNATKGFVKVTVQIKATSAMNVRIAPSFTPGAVPFLYGAVIQGANVRVLGSTGDSYYPIAGPTVECVDTNANDIVDTGDGGFNSSMLGSQVTVSPTTTIDVSLAANTPETITLLMWAEGQDTNCSGPISASTSAMTLQVTKI